MSSLMLATFAAMVVATSFLSGIFGMAGGMMLMGGLLFMVGVADAMILHGITQFVATGWRGAMWHRHVDWRMVARFGLGLVVATLLFVWARFTPDQRLVFIFLGLTPFFGALLPARLVPQMGRRLGAETSGFVCTALILLSGVSGPLLDLFFARSALDRRVIVATKAVCQAISHVAKLLYFGLLVSGVPEVASNPAVIGVAVAAAIVGTMSSRRILERMSDRNFRRYTLWIVMALGAVYLLRGAAGYLPAGA